MAFEWTWLRGEFDDPLEVKTFAAVKIVLDGRVITRLYDKQAGGDRDAVHVPLYPLALSIAQNWWSLLYEPRKFENSTVEESRHSLDGCMGGFVFPALTLWSGGDDAVIVETPDVPQRFSNLEFFRSPAPEVLNLLRDEVENDLFTLISAVVERLSQNRFACELRESWGRVLESLGDQQERRYCVAAGRLGLDPYDPDAPDISAFAEVISESLFADVCDATTQRELPAAVEWARVGEQSLGNFPEMNVSEFGIWPIRDPRSRIWEHGYQCARIARRNLGLDDISPRRAIDRIFGAAVRVDAPTLTSAPHSALEGIAGRAQGAMRVALPKSPSRLRRSGLCRAAYLAWATADGTSSAVTTASTLEQQASRAFAAELLAPAEWLKGQAGPHGLTPNDVERIASENVCPQSTVIWQAYNNDIPLRGVVLPHS